MNNLRWNWPIWLGFVLNVAAFISYPFVFVKYPCTRDFPWANFLLFGVSSVFLWAGWKRVFGGARPFRGKVVSSILTVLSVSILGFFCFLNFHMTRNLPASAGSPQIGEKAPEFALRDTHDNLVSLSALLSTPLDPSSPSRSAPKGVVLIFYRGYW